MVFEHHQQGETADSTAKPAVGHVSRGTILLALAAIAIDAGAQANHVVSQRVVLSLRPEAASRLNSLYIAIFFLGGAASSAISSPLFFAGWATLGLVGAGLCAAALGLWPAMTSVRPTMLPIPNKLTRWRIKCPNSKAGFHAAI
jgi:hypothetical protein